MGRRPAVSTLVALLAVCLLVPASFRVRGATPLIQIGTAFVTQDSNAKGWVIGNDLIEYSLGQQGTSFNVRDLRDPVSGREWRQALAPDLVLVVNGQRVSIGSTGTVYERSQVTEWWGGVRLDVMYRVASASLNVTRSYACYPGSSVIETWTTLQAPPSRAVTVSNLNNYSLTVTNGTVRWLRGLQTPEEESGAYTGGAFTLASVQLQDGQAFEIGSDSRASSQAVPWFSIRGDDVNADDPEAWKPQFFGAMLWAGSWRTHIQRQAGRVDVQVGLPDIETTLSAGAVLETPHAIFGLTNPSVPEVSVALRSFIDLGVRHGRPLRADVTFNTWFTYGTFTDDASMRAEMDLAASLGIEQFVVDAGWWAGINLDDPTDFTTGLGNWQVDPDRFPDGLGALTDYAHQLGMRFGVWVEPERVAMETVGQPGLAQSRFLATSNGRIDPSVPDSDAVAGQICLADPEARAWVTGKLHEFLDNVRPDYLKWDNNSWINCDSTRHGHGLHDGNLQHMRGLESVLADLRASYPDMDIENSAGGGNRLSLGMLAYTDAGWVDDRSWPSTHVRHDLGGLATLFPPAYLFSFAMSDGTEEMGAGPDQDLELLVRSRMVGMLGGAWRGVWFNDGTKAVLAKQIALYKEIRPTIQQGAAILLGQQVVTYPDQPWSGWDAIEHLQPNSGDAVVLAFDTPDAPASAIVKPRALKADLDYAVESADYGVLGVVSGADLMDSGIELNTSGVTHSHVLIFRALPPPDESAVRAVRGGRR